MTLLEGVVEDLSHDGRGVVRVDGKVYFVEGALPEERIQFSRQKRHRKHEIGKLDSVLKPSKDRVTPPCQYFGVCGGCATQHLSSDAQLAFKQQTMLHNLERLGKVIPERILEPLSGPVAGYRRKARLGIRYVPKKGGVLVGFRERNKSYITSLAHCVALHPKISDLLPGLHELVAQMSCFNRLPQIEVAVGDAHAALVFRHLEPLVEKDLSLLTRFAEEHDVDVFLQPGGLDTITALKQETVRTLSYGLPDYTVDIEFKPTDFVQVNSVINKRLVALALDLIKPDTADCVLELFCGIGNFSLPLARCVKQVVAAEADRNMVDRARHNAEHNGIDNAEFVVADLYSNQIESLATYSQCNKLFLDPPRSGAIEVVRDLVPRLRPESIVYVSCNPSTLARDSEVLVYKEGYTLKAAGAVDMFPHTAHVESIALFEK